MRVLTDWYPGTVKPVRDGFYLLRYRDDLHNGTLRRFFNSAFRYDNGVPFPFTMNIEWCGLAFDPNSVEEIYSIHRGPGLFFPLTMVPR